ncbi:hypothetical protein PGTUg99_014683 [Puccinia graminis f. sp. tritici]|uniref:Uncharacterized protein n=1 Tax=Puccinia graminis f. sp. tritici TaxID=56615 RepID=A0A5B0RYZ6_PUCGR|nr:hypothetical protein PGTUg99_014683 [Puccinia graminis f. sp. tritici]
MAEKSVHKHMRYDKHRSALAAFYVAQAAGATSSRLETEISPSIGGTGDEQLQATEPEVYEDAQTSAAWCRWEGLDIEPDVQADLREMDGSEEELNYSTESFAGSACSGYVLDSELSAYDSNNEADDEEWDLPNNPNEAERDESFRLGHTNEPGRHHRSRRAHNPWWPYKSKEYLIASLLIGYTHHIVSRSLYAHIRLLFKFYDIILPDWTTIRREKKKTRMLLDCDVLPSVSIFSTPTYRLSLPRILAQEVANPQVSPVIDYYPQQANGQNIYKLSQSAKWLSDLEPSCRAPMYRSSGGDWYLYEPVQMKNDEVLMPVFFFQLAGEMHSKCAVPDYTPVGDGNQLRMTFPAGIPFGCESLRTVKVSDFDYNYSEITDAEGQLLATRCRDSIYGEGIIVNIHA